MVILCLVCLTAAAPAGAQGEGTTPSEEAAIQAFRQGSFSRAVELYRQALQETDDANHRARLHINIAWTLFALGRESEVQTHLRAALVEDPNLTLLPDYYTQEFIDLFDRARMRSVSGESAAPPPDLGTPEGRAWKESIQARLATVQQEWFTLDTPRGLDETRRYRGPVTLLRIREQPYWRIRDDALGWRRHADDVRIVHMGPYQQKSGAADGLTRHEIHLGLLREPGVRDTARAIMDALEPLEAPSRREAAPTYA